MAYQIADLESDIVGAGHGAALNKVKNKLNLYFRAASSFLLDCDPPETKRVATISNGLYHEVYDYPAFSDLKRDKIIDIRPQVNRTNSDNFTKTGNEEFDQRKTNKDFTVEHRTGTKVLRVAKVLTGKVLIHDMNSVTSNGTWSASGGAASLAADDLYKVQGGFSLKFNIGASGGTISNSNMTSVDLSTHQEVSSLFLWIYFPNSSRITSVQLRWGSSSSNYWSRTVTAPHFGSFADGWNLLRFDWNGATQTGSVDETAINFLSVIVVSTSSDTNIRVDEITSKLPTIYDALYYSAFLFRNKNGVWIEKPTVDTDLVNLDTDNYMVYFNKVMILVAQEVQGTSAAFDYSFFTKEYENGIKRLKGLSPSEAAKQRNYYYRM